MAKYDNTKKRPEYYYDERYSTLKETARRVKRTPNKLYMPIKVGDSIDESSAEGIFKANKFLRNRRYANAYLCLKQTYYNVLEDPVKERRNDNLIAIQKRLKKISYDVLKAGKGQRPRELIVGDDFFAEEAIILDREIEGLKGREGGLEKTIGISSIVLLTGSIFFLSNGLTSNVISNLNNTTINVIGVILFLLGIAGALLYFNRKK